MMPLSQTIWLPGGPRPCREYDPNFDGPLICNCRTCNLELSSSPADRERWGIAKLGGIVLGVPYCERCIKALVPKDGPVKKQRK